MAQVQKQKRRVSQDDKRWLQTAAEHGFHYESIPDVMITPNPKPKIQEGDLIAVDLFAGAGGVSCGFHMAREDGVNIHVPVAVDTDKWAMLTYMANLGKDLEQPVAYIRKDIHDLTAVDIIHYLELLGYPPMADMMHSSPPCKDFSSANTVFKSKLAYTYKVGHRSCMLETVRILKELRPRFLTLENVTGMVHGKMRPLFDQWLATVKDAGYHVTWDILDAADFGVPQHRERVFVIAQDQIQYSFVEDCGMAWASCVASGKFNPLEVEAPKPETLVYLK